MPHTARMDLRTLRVVVTGATGGIGSELVAALAAEGCRVVAAGRSETRLAALRSAHPAIETVRADLQTPAGRIAFAEEVLAGGAVDVLINNAGTQTPVDALDPVEWSLLDDELQLNLHAPIHLGHLLLPSLIERHPDAPEAAIVNVTSGLALAPKASSAPYCASKAALRSYSKALRWQLRSSPVRVVEALPPLVRTEMTAGRNEGAMEPAACAAAIVRGLRRGRAEIYVGKSKLLRVIMRVAPSLGERIMRDS
jgi:uncharacterized oxidoreductase